MIEIKTKLQKWGNSFGIVVPLGIAKKEVIKEGDEITALILRKETTNTKDIFGSHKFSKPINQLLKEADKELYNE